MADDDSPTLMSHLIGGGTNSSSHEFGSAAGRALSRGSLDRGSFFSHQDNSSIPVLESASATTAASSSSSFVSSSFADHSSAKTSKPNKLKLMLDKQNDKYKHEKVYTIPYAHLDLI